MTWLDIKKKTKEFFKNTIKVPSVFLPLPLSSFKTAQSENGPAHNSE